MSLARKLSFMSGLALAAALMLVLKSHADVSNQATEITFSQSVSIPGATLPAGTYWFTVLDDTGTNNTQVVQIFNADHTRLISQQISRTVEPAQFGQDVVAKGVRWPSGKLVLTFAEGQTADGSALLAWYYPGDTAGHEFIYNNHQQKQLDEETQQTIAVNAGTTIKIGRNSAAFE